ncbi:MAG: LLM class flavin-dependent oxidoreductase [Anaerolineales bacterium]|nr:LLM class flavin-dependent oxidoreductase [Anaerolineales bacterium]
MQISLNIEGMSGLNWPRWKRFVREFERMGYDGVFVSDHFTWPFPPDLDSLELFVGLTYLADHTERIHFGSLVSPFSFRDPVFMARQAAAIDDLSGGRMVLGVGAGWQDREHNKFGFDLGDMKTRMDRLEEGLEVVTRLTRSRDPVTYHGRFYRLDEAQLKPRPEQPTRILVGAKGPRRSLPMVARYADVWNCSAATPDEFRGYSDRLDALAVEAGRDPADIKRTLMLTAFCWRNAAEKEDRMSKIRESLPFFASAPTDELAEDLAGRAGVMGTPDDVVEKLKEFEAVGVEEVMIQWFSMDDVEGLGVIGEEVIPHFRE